jgi:tRNA nucleotidyltransferase (CCA-adding enzyme)
LRAVRFESQLGFRLEPGSEQLARTTLKNRQFAGFGSKRVMKELQRILCLPHPLQAIDRLNDLGALSLIHPQLTLNPHTRRSLRLAHRLALTAKLEPTDSSALYLSILLGKLASFEQIEALRSLQFSRSAWNRILAPIEALEEWSRGAPSASRIHRLLQRFDNWAILAVMVLGRSHPISPWLRRFRRDWRFKAVEHSGADLLRLGLTPGPRYAQILEALLEAKLTHPLPDKSAENAWLVTYLKAAPAAGGESSRGPD